jgi:chromosome segregation ATPase
MIKERFDSVKIGYETSKRDLQALQVRLSSLSETLTSHLAANVEVLTEKLDRKEEEGRHLRAEREGLRMTETRLLAEIKSLANEKKRVSDMLRDMQRLYDALQNSFKEEKAKLEERVDRREKELDLARRESQGLLEDLKAVIARKELDGKEQALKIEKLRDELARVKEDLAGRDGARCFQAPHAGTDDQGQYAGRDAQDLRGECGESSLGGCAGRQSAGT